jgi:hypothetical protein
MNNMKKAIAPLAFTLIFIGSGFYYLRTHALCAQSLRYSIGAFDSRFGITKSEFTKIAEEASSMWTRAAGKPLFFYDPNASFKVNLIYDERQARTDEYTKIKLVLEVSESSFKSVEYEYKYLIADYDNKNAAYAAEIKKFDADLVAYNKDVDYWNVHGGAPETQYNDLQTRKAALGKRSQSIGADRNELNSLGRRINILADQGNSLASNYNDTVSTYNQKFGTTTEFDQGIYHGNEIDVYEFKEMSDLRMVLAHEFGHALGIDHVSDPHSIMYYFMGEQNLNHLAPSADDITALSKRCGLK